MPFILDSMRTEDVSEVAAIERQSFTTPWPVHVYSRELKENRNSRYIVLRWVEPQNGRDSANEPDIAPRSPEILSSLTQPRQSTASLWQAMWRWLPFQRKEPPAEVVDNTPQGTIVGYAGIWLILDEAHITTIAVRPDYRGRGAGELLLQRVIEITQEMGGKRVTLEVRVSNEVAQSLYRKYSFKIEGVRRRYYSDDKEDANIMWSDEIDSAEFLSHFGELRAALRKRLGPDFNDS